MSSSAAGWEGACAWRGQGDLRQVGSGWQCGGEAGPGSLDRPGQPDVQDQMRAGPPPPVEGGPADIPLWGERCHSIQGAVAEHLTPRSPTPTANRNPRPWLWGQCRIQLPFALGTCT